MCWWLNKIQYLLNEEIWYIISKVQIKCEDLDVWKGSDGAKQGCWQGKSEVIIVQKVQLNSSFFGYDGVSNGVMGLIGVMVNEWEKEASILRDVGGKTELWQLWMQFCLNSRDNRNIIME